MASAAMDILLVGLKMTFQLILWRMYIAMGVLVKYVSHIPQKIVWNTMVCAVVLLTYMIRRFILWKKKHMAKRFAAQLGESREFTQIRRIQACEVSMSPPEGLRPLKLKTLCLAVLCENTNRFYPLLEDLLKEEQNGELPELSFHGLLMACAEVQKRLRRESSNSLQVQGAEIKNILEASQKHISQADKDMPDDLVTLADAMENIPLLSQGAAKCMEGAQERGGAEQPACVKIEIPE